CRGTARFINKPGGAPAKVAVGVQQLGHPCAFMTQVGDDPFGRYLAGVLEAEGVDVSGISYSETARTALAFVSLAEGGERDFMFYRHPSADMLMTEADLKLELMDDAKIFHFGSITLIEEPARTATLKAAQSALDKNLLVSYDPNLREPLWSSKDAAREGMLAGLDYAHIVKISDVELEFLGGSVEALWRDRTQLILVTAGPDGATAYTRNGNVTVPGYSVESVDTTGAGDAFVAGVLVGVLERDDYTDLETLKDMLAFANATGAIATTQRGAIPSLPTREAAEAFIKAQGK
ncbi:MAG: PfkB family carbohydrate kinase, partial [Chloroflexota bacterium]